MCRLQWVPEAISSCIDLLEENQTFIYKQRSTTQVTLVEGHAGRRSHWLKVTSVEGHTGQRVTLARRSTTDKTPSRSGYLFQERDVHSQLVMIRVEL